MVSHLTSCDSLDVPPSVVQWNEYIRCVASGSFHKTCRLDSRSRRPVPRCGIWCCMRCTGPWPKSREPLRGTAWTVGSTASVSYIGRGWKNVNGWVKQLYCLSVPLHSIGGLASLVEVHFWAGNRDPTCHQPVWDVHKLTTLSVMIFNMEGIGLIIKFCI